MVKQRTDAGLSRQADLTQSYGRLALAKANLLAAQNNYQDANDIYYKVIGKRPKDLLKPKSPPSAMLPRTEHDAVQAAVNNHPLLKSAKADVQEASAQKRSARSPFWPRIDVSAVGTKGYDLNEIRSLEGDYDNYGAFVSLKYNLFKGGSDLARYRETVYLEDQAKQIRNRTYDQVVENMQLAWNGLTTSRSQLIYFQKHRDSAQLTLQAYRQQFQLGKRTLLDLLNSNEELFNAATDYVNGQYKYLFAKFRMLNAEGKLLDYLNIQEPVTYTVTDREKHDLHQMEHSSKVRLPHLREYPVVRKGYRYR
jgi:adhesin transport system outer membrane protein